MAFVVLQVVSCCPCYSYQVYYSRRDGSRRSHPDISACAFLHSVYDDRRYPPISLLLLPLHVVAASADRHRDPVEARSYSRPLPIRFD